MAKIIKNSVGNFLVICLIFLIMTGWLFSGWPRIWQNPPIPPEIKQAYAYSSLGVEKGSFTRQAGTGNQTVTLTDSGLTPKVVIFFGTNQTSEGFATPEQSFWGYMVNATQQRAYGSAQAAGSKNHKERGAVKAIVIIDTAGAIDADADWVSFNAGNFVINWTTNDGAAANIIHYIALGGDALANVEVGDFSINIATGNQEINLAGTFEPKLVLFMGSRAITAYPADTTQDSMFWGMAKSSTARGGMGADLKGDKTFTTQRTDRMISIFSGANVIIGDADFVSMDADGFTINVTDAPVLASKVAYLAFGGVSLDADVGSFNQPSSTGIQEITTTHEPDIVWFQSWGKVTSASVSNLTQNSWGAATASTEEGGIVLSLDDGKNNYNGTLMTKVIQLVTAGAPPTVDAEADFDSFTTTSFKVNWTTVDATAREVLFWTLGGIHNLPPTTPTLAETPAFPNMDTLDTTPVLGTFSSTDAESEPIEYDIQWDEDFNFGTPVTNNSADFATNGFTAATFTSGANVSYTVQAGEALTNGQTYWWRARARDPSGSNTWSSYSAKRSITIDTSITVSQWFQTTTEQFDTGTLTDTGTTTGGVKVKGW